MNECFTEPAEHGENVLVECPFPKLPFRHMVRDHPFVKDSARCINDLFRRCVRELCLGDSYGHRAAVDSYRGQAKKAACATHSMSAGTNNGVSAGTNNGKIAHNGHDVGDRLAVGLLNECDSVVYDGGCTGWSLYLEHAEAHAAARGTRARVRKLRDLRPTPLVKPDATLVLSITTGTAGSDNDDTSPFRYQGDWRKAMLPTLQSPADMRAAEELGHIRFRHMFMEMETGSNSSRDMVGKIGRYNRLYRLLCEGDMMYGQRWRTLFGPALPVILVAVRDSSQVGAQVTLWRRYFNYKAPGLVVLANLGVLAQVYGMGQSQLLRRACWLDVMPEDPKWQALGEILGLQV